MRPLQEFIEAEWRMYADNSCRLIATKPSSDEMVVYCSLVPYFSEIWIKIHNFLLKKMHSKMLSAKCLPRCLDLDVLNCHPTMRSYHWNTFEDRVAADGMGISRLILGLHPTDGRRRYFVTTSLILLDASQASHLLYKFSVSTLIALIWPGWEGTLLLSSSVSTRWHIMLLTLLAFADWRTPYWWLPTHLRQLSTRPSAANKLNWLKL